MLSSVKGGNQVSWQSGQSTARQLLQYEHISPRADAASRFRKNAVRSGASKVKEG